ncbi:MAG TPA: TonB family protein [Candidatus Sulfotelmatobacter sp.]|nr:TonB family protein [Candidatus Sulfotelmatobacter sp.]
MPEADAKAGRITPERASSLAASLALHVLVAGVVLFWRDRPPPQTGPVAIQVEFIPETPPAASKPAVKPLSRQQPAMVAPTPEALPSPPPRQTPSTPQDIKRYPSPEKAPPVETGDIAQGDPLENYGIILGHMVQRHVHYPASAVPRREKGPVTLSIVLAHDGTLLAVHADAQSRLEFAEAAVEAVHAAAPFPPFPRGLDVAKADFNISLYFQYKDSE